MKTLDEAIEATFLVAVVSHEGEPTKAEYQKAFETAVSRVSAREDLIAEAVSNMRVARLAHGLCEAAEEDTPLTLLVGMGIAHGIVIGIEMERSETGGISNA